MVEQYIQAYYNTTKWPFIPVNFVIYELKGFQSAKDIRKELNELFKAGKIAKRKYINGTLIEILNK